MLRGLCGDQLWPHRADALEVAPQVVPVPAGVGSGAGAGVEHAAQQPSGVLVHPSWRRCRQAGQLGEVTGPRARAVQLVVPVVQRLPGRVQRRVIVVRSLQGSAESDE